jgi:hypothetical protein
MSLRTEMSDYDLDRINAERERRGRRPGAALARRPWRGGVRSKASWQPDCYRSENQDDQDRRSASGKPLGERANLFGGGQARVGAGGGLGAHQGGLLRRRRDAEGSRRPRLGAAVGPGGDRAGGLLDLGNRHCPRSKQAKHNGDPAWDTAIAVSPPADTSRTDAEELGDVALCDTERAERRVEVGRVRLFRLIQNAPQREAGRQRLRTAILTLK